MALELIELMSCEAPIVLGNIEVEFVDGIWTLTHLPDDDTLSAALDNADVKNVGEHKVVECPEVNQLTLPDKPALCVSIRDVALKGQSVPLVLLQIVNARRNVGLSDYFCYELGKDGEDYYLVHPRLGASEFNNYDERDLTAGSLPIMIKNPDYEQHPTGLASEMDIINKYIPPMQDMIGRMVMLMQTGYIQSLSQGTTLQ